MAPKLLSLVLCSAILVHNLQGQSTGAGANSKGIDKRNKLLKAYEDFEAHLKDSITSIINNLHKEQDCEHGEDENGTCRKKPETDSQIPHEDNLIDDSLLERVENINGVLLALIPRKFPIVHWTRTRYLMENLKVSIMLDSQFRHPRWKPTQPPPMFIIQL